MVIAPVASARYSRCRDTAACTTAATERRDDERREPEDEHDQVAAAASPVAAAEERDAQEQVGDEADRDDEAEHDHRDPDVVVLDVPHLVRHDALELVVGEDLEDAGGRRDARVLRVTPGRERVRRRVVDDVHLGHRQALGDREVLDDAVQPRVVRLLDLVRTAHRQREGARGEVLEQRVPDRDHQRDDDDRHILVDPGRQRTEAADDQDEQDDDEDGVALVLRDRAIHAAI